MLLLWEAREWSAAGVLLGDMCWLWPQSRTPTLCNFCSARHWICIKCSLTKYVCVRIVGLVFNLLPRSFDALHNNILLIFLHYMYNNSLLVGFPCVGLPRLPSFVSV